MGLVVPRVVHAKLMTCAQIVSTSKHCLKACLCTVIINFG
jgi:hypothetical protein